jgi:hypothetical protein
MSATEVEDRSIRAESKALADRLPMIRDALKGHPDPLMSARY